MQVAPEGELCWRKKKCCHPANGRKRMSHSAFFFSPHFELRSSEDEPLAYKLCKHIIVPSLHRWQLFPREKKMGEAEKETRRRQGAPMIQKPLPPLFARASLA